MLYGYRIVRRFFLLSILFFPPSCALADTASLVAQPVRILVSEKYYGGCLVLLSKNPQDVLPSCRAKWVTMSCDGTFLPKDLSNRLMEQVQMSFALNRSLGVYIDDSRQHNGYCLAYRIDLF